MVWCTVRSFLQLTLRGVYIPHPYRRAWTTSTISRAISSSNNVSRAVVKLPPVTVGAHLPRTTPSVDLDRQVGDFSDGVAPPW